MYNNIVTLNIENDHTHLQRIYTSYSKLEDITRDVCKSRIHDRRDYRDFRLVPWFSTIAVILCHGRDYHQNRCNFNFQTVNLSKYL